MLSENSINYLLSHTKEKVNISDLEDVKDDISIEEAIEIYNEILDVMRKHNITYRCGMNIIVSLLSAFADYGFAMDEDNSDSDMY